MVYAMPASRAVAGCNPGAAANACMRTGATGRASFLHDQSLYHNGTTGYIIMLRLTSPPRYDCLGPGVQGTQV